MVEIKILGTGCPKCNKLESMVKEVVREKAIEAEVSKVTNINEIAKAGVMLTPGLMVDGDVKLAGKLPTKDSLIKILTAG